MTKVVLTIKKTTLLMLSLILIIFGIISLILPLSPGLVFIILGLSLAAKTSLTVRDHHLVNKILTFFRSKLEMVKEILE